MSKITKRVVIELEFENTKEGSTPHIKDWWLTKMIEKVVSDKTDYMNSRIHDIVITVGNATVLQEEYTVKLSDILKKG